MKPPADRPLTSRELVAAVEAAVPTGGDYLKRVEAFLGALGLDGLAWIRARRDVVLEDAGIVR